MIINTDFLTEEELAEYRTSSLMVAALESAATHREIQAQKKKETKQKEDPRFKIADLQSGVEAYKLFKEVRLCGSYSEAKKLIRQGGMYLNGGKVEDPYTVIKTEDAIGGVLQLRRGKKRIFTINVKSSNTNL